MTIIAGFSRIGDSAIAGDSLASSSQVKFNSTSKVYSITPQIAVGLAGSYIVQAFIEEKIAHYFVGSNPMDEEFISVIRRMWRAWRRHCRNKGMGTISDDTGILTIPGDLMIVTPMHVYTCQTDGSVLQHEMYAAIGSGQYVAMGAMHALAEVDMTETVADIVYAACEAAIAHVPSCGGEIDTIEVKSVLPASNI
jgi:ATP-dependent protease HslVU (ClpYQ) peptidase subunit